MHGLDKLARLTVLLAVGDEEGFERDSTALPVMLTSTAAITLSITAPNFSLTASPVSLTVKQGNTGSSTITVGPQNGFMGSVSLAAPSPRQAAVRPGPVGAGGSAVPPRASATIWT